MVPLADKGKELLCLSAVLAYLKSEWQPLVSSELLQSLPELSAKDWHQFIESVKGQLVANPSKVRKKQKLHLR